MLGPGDRAVELEHAGPEALVAEGVLPEDVPAVVEHPLRSAIDLRRPGGRRPRHRGDVEERAPGKEQGRGREAQSDDPDDAGPAHSAPPPPPQRGKICTDNCAYLLSK